MDDKAFFDWLRSQQEDKQLTQEMVDGANELLAYMTPTKLKSALSKVNDWRDGEGAMTLSEAGSDMIKRYEKYMGNPYLDAVGKWTIGYGNTYYENRQPVRRNDPAISEKRASELKRNIINMDFAPAVNLLFAEEIADGKITQNMFDALVSLAYNIGTRGLAGSSVAKYIKQGDMQRAADNFLAWNKGRVNGRLQVLNGLVRRRNEERDLFLA